MFGGPINAVSCPTPCSPNSKAAGPHRSGCAPLEAPVYTVLSNRRPAQLCRPSDRRSGHLQARAARIDQLCPRANIVTEAAVGAALRAGFSVRGWGVKSIEVSAGLVLWASG